MPEFKLPDLGEGVTEAEIDRWLVKEGDVVAEDDPLLEVITDKATAEIPSPFEGLVRTIHVKAGDVVPVGTTLVTIGDAGTSAPTTSAAPAPQEAAPEDSRAARTTSESRSSNAVEAMPPVRKLARELDVDLSLVEGSGPGGRVMREDVESFAARAGDVAAGKPSVGRREPLRGVRRTIAERMTQAHRVIPAVTHVEECDVTELEATRSLANERGSGEARLTFLPFIVKAVVAALKAYPALNASLDEESQEIVFHDHYNIGVAVDTPQGLVVPVIRDADRKKLRDLAEEVNRLAEGARKSTLSTEDLRGGTFTVTSPGAFGGLLATPIVLHPQSGILGVHRAVERPVARDGQIVIRKMMNLSITFDHRVLDGMTAARFALEVVRLLEHPAVLALES